MWKASHWCDDGVIVCYMQAVNDPDNFIAVNRDIGGEFNRETWIEVPSGWVVVASSVTDDEGLVTEFAIEGGQTIHSSEQPCLCAALTSMQRTTAWLNAGGVSTKVGSA